MALFQAGVKQLTLTRELVGEVNVASGSAAVSALKINGVFSNKYVNYEVIYTAQCAAQGTTAKALCLQFGTGGTLTEDGTEFQASEHFKQVDVTTDGGAVMTASDGMGLNGTFTTTAYLATGIIRISNPFQSARIEVSHEGQFSYLTGTSMWGYYGYGESTTEPSGYTDVYLNIIGNTFGTSNASSNDLSALTKYTSFGKMKVYGIRGWDWGGDL